MKWFWYLYCCDAAWFETEKESLQSVQNHCWFNHDSVRNHLIAPALLPFLGKGSIYMGTPSSLPLIQPWAAEGRGRAASSSTGAADFELNHVCQFWSQKRQSSRPRSGWASWRQWRGWSSSPTSTHGQGGERVKNKSSPLHQKNGYLSQKIRGLFYSIAPFLFLFYCACLFFQSNWVVATVSKWLKNPFYLLTTNNFSIC